MKKAPLIYKEMLFYFVLATSTVVSSTIAATAENKY